MGLHQLRYSVQDPVKVSFCELCPKYLGEIEKERLILPSQSTIINKIATALEQDMSNFLDTKTNQEKNSYLGKINSLLEEKDEATLSDIAKVLEILVG